MRFQEFIAMSINPDTTLLQDVSRKCTIGNTTIDNTIFNGKHIPY